MGRRRRGSSPDALAHMPPGLRWAEPGTPEFAEGLEWCRHFGVPTLGLFVRRHVLRRWLAGVELGPAHAGVLADLLAELAEREARGETVPTRATADTQNPARPGTGGGSGRVRVTPQAFTGRRRGRSC